MAATRVNLNGINELDLNLSGTTTATVAAGVTTVTNTPITPAIATATTVGVVKPDNNTIQVAVDGTLTSSGAAPAFVQASAASGSTAITLALSGISLGNTLIYHLRCGNTTPPPTTGIGNAYVLVGSVANSFWGVYTYTYICFGALATTESLIISGIVGTGVGIIAEYTTAGGYEVFANNGVSANFSTTSTLAITSTKAYERALFFWSCDGTGTGFTYNQTVRSNTLSAMTLMDAPDITAGTTITGIQTGATNQSSMSGVFLTPLGTVRSVGLSMPSDFTVTGSPVTNIGTIQVTGGVTVASIQQESLVYSADTGAANAYAITLVPAPTIVTGSEIVFKAQNPNTGASTVTVNGTSYPLLKNGGTALVPGDITSGQMITGKFDGVNFQFTVGGSGGGTAGVSSLNALTGALSITAGTNITVTPSGSSILVAATGTGVTAAGGIASISGSTLSVGKVSPVAASSAVVTNPSSNTIDTTHAGATFNLILGGSSNTCGNATNQFIGGAGTGNSTTTNNSSVLSGSSNTASATDAVVVGGNGNTASGARAVSGGFGCIASGTASVALGDTNTSSGNESASFGQNNTASGTNSIVLGLAGSDRGNVRSFAMNSGGLASTKSFPGRAQWEEHILSIQTSGASAVRLTADEGAAGAANVAAIGNTSSALFTADVLCANKSTGATLTYTFGPSLITRAASASTTLMASGNPAGVAGPTTASPPTLAAAPTITADVTNGGFNVSVTPPTGNVNTWYFLCRIRMLVSQYN